ncbi:hypothetical protein D3C80_2036590 [compost metagenome]
MASTINKDEIPLVPWSTDDGALPETDGTPRGGGEGKRPARSRRKSIRFRIKRVRRKMLVWYFSRFG